MIHLPSLSNKFSTGSVRAHPRQRRRSLRSLAAIVPVSVLASVTALALSVGTAEASTSSAYGYSSLYQSFTVPVGVTSLHVDVSGGSGANGAGSYTGGLGAAGGRVIGDLPVTPGEILKLWVGGAGQSNGAPGFGSPSHDDFEGGWGGSPTGAVFGTGTGGGGGAASYIELNGAPLVVGGGGGGGGGSGSAVITGSPAGGDASSGGYGFPGDIRSNAYTNWAGQGGAGGLPGAPDATGSDNGGDGGNGGRGDIGGGGGGGGAGYANCDATFGMCFSAGSGGVGGVGSYGGNGGAGGNSYIAPSLTNVSVDRSTFSAGRPGQITLTYADASTTTVTSTSGSAYPGQPVTFHAFVGPTDGGGTVSFTADGHAIAGCGALPFVSGGGTDWAATCTTSSLPVGHDTITATYSGDGAYAGSSASTAEVITGTTTSTSLTAAPSTPAVGANVTLTATVRSSDGGGSVAFTQNGAVLEACGAVPLVYSNGVYRATCKHSWPQAGTNSVLAAYSGDAGYAPSSGSASVTVHTVPVVSSVSPNAGPTTGGRTVTITGSNLTGATNVTFGGVGGSNVAVVSDTKLTVTVPAHVAAAVNVLVTSLKGTSMMSAGGRYTYDDIPAVASISPANGPAGTVVIVNGTGFAPGATVAFGSKPAAKVVRVSNTQLKATAPAGSGGADIVVATPGGTSATSGADRFTYAAS